MNPKMTILRQFSLTHVVEQGESWLDLRCVACGTELIEWRMRAFRDSLSVASVVDAVRRHVHLTD